MTNVTVHRPAPFLSILTRTGRRPNMLALNRESVDSQFSGDHGFVEQILIEDEIGRGMEWANDQFCKHREVVDGRFVLLLDDDDYLASVYTVVQMHTAVLGGDVDVLAFRVDHGPQLGILPNDDDFGKRPERCHIGGSSVIVRRELWQDTIHEFKGERCADYRWLSYLWDQNPNINWLDEVLVKCQRISGGAPE